MELTIYSEHSFKHCGGTWKYCNGQCSKCAMTGTITSNSTQFIESKNTYNNTTDNKETKDNLYV